MAPNVTKLGAAIRRDFPLLRQSGGRAGRNVSPLVYLDSAATTPCPNPVLAAMQDVSQEHYANVHRGGYWEAQETTQRYETVRDQVQRFLGARHPEEVIFTAGATDGLNLIAHSWGDLFLSPGDEILMTDMEHHANIVPWQQTAQRTGAILRFASVTDEGRLDLPAFESLLNGRTKLVAITAVSNVLGTINPIHTITRRAHQAGAVVIVDAAQVIGHRPIDVAEWDVDFLVFSAHKMLGPNGVGVLYGRRDFLEAMPPFRGGGNMVASVARDGFIPAGLPAKFEAGTPPIVPVIGLGAAIEYLTAVGWTAIHQHEQQLIDRLHRLLAAIREVRVLGPTPSEKAGIVSFVVPDWDPVDLAYELGKQRFAVRGGHHCAQPLHQRYGIDGSVRASVYLYNTHADVELFVSALSRIIDGVSGTLP